MAKKKKEFTEKEFTDIQNLLIMLQAHIQDFETENTNQKKIINSELEEINSALEEINSELKWMKQYLNDADNTQCNFAVIPKMIKFLRLLFDKKSDPKFDKRFYNHVVQGLDEMDEELLRINDRIGGEEIAVSDSMSNQIDNFKKLNWLDNRFDDIMAEIKFDKNINDKEPVINDIKQCKKNLKEILGNNNNDKRLSIRGDKLKKIHGNLLDMQKKWDKIGYVSGRIKQVFSKISEKIVSWLGDLLFEKKEEKTASVSTKQNLEKIKNEQKKSSSDNTKKTGEYINKKPKI